MINNRLKALISGVAFIGLAATIPRSPSYREKQEKERLQRHYLNAIHNHQSIPYSNKDYDDSVESYLDRIRDELSKPTECQSNPNFDDSVFKNKRYVAERAIEDYVKDGMTIGMGTGSTCLQAVEVIARKVRSGELSNIKLIPCSVEMKKHCIGLGIPVSSLSFSSGNLDVMIDGADEIDPNMALIKGGSGSFLREKMMENYSNQDIILADDTKLVSSLGPGHPLPVEVVSWDFERTIKLIEALPSMKGVRGMLRRGNISSPIPDGEYPAVTDNGNLIVDLYFYKPIEDASAASADLDGLSGVVEHGLFAGQATTILVASSDAKHPLRILGHAPGHEDEVETPWWIHQPHGHGYARETIDHRQPTTEEDFLGGVMATPWMRLKDKYRNQNKAATIDSKTGMENPVSYENKRDI